MRLMIKDVKIVHCEKHNKFDIHPYAVLELKQLVSKEAAVKATPTPTTPIHP